jgi:hypothetical protein
VCTENSVLIDYVTESPNVTGDDRSVMLLPDKDKRELCAYSEIKARQSAKIRQLAEAAKLLDSKRSTSLRTGGRLLLPFRALFRAL